MDIKTWAEKRNSRTPFTITDSLTYTNGKLNYKDAIGYKGTYDGKNGVNHAIYVVYAKNDDRGIQMICDVTTELIEKVEPEFMKTIQSIRK